MGSLSVVVVLGKGPGWETELHTVFSRIGIVDVIGINEAALWLSTPPRYAFSWHIEEMLLVKEIRPEVITHGVTEYDGIDHAWINTVREAGSSALMAGRLAVQELGYDRVIFCGVPLSGMYNRFIPEWWAYREELKKNMWSMSPRTSDILGFPDWEEINRSQDAASPESNLCR